MCRASDLESAAFLDWAQAMGERPGHMHRKVWEFCYIAQALHERGQLRPDSSGLGFAVGQEPLSALFAQNGVNILATDLDPGHAEQTNWIETGQHAASIDALNQRNLCPAEEFRDRVHFRTVDMRKLPDDLGTFDFLWSACALEHLGSIRAGQSVYPRITQISQAGRRCGPYDCNTTSPPGFGPSRAAKRSFSAIGIYGQWHDNCASKVIGLNWISQRATAPPTAM